MWEPERAGRGLQYGPRPPERDKHTQQEGKRETAEVTMAARQWHGEDRE